MSWRFIRQLFRCRLQFIIQDQSVGNEKAQLGWRANRQPFLVSTIINIIEKAHPA
jgi:hypothetical protein